jgi:hypothetical protein
MTSKQQRTRLPYRSHSRRVAQPEAGDDAEQFNADIAFTTAFIWATALLRFVIVWKRHEAFTADPIFAALLTFGIPAGVVVYGLLATWVAWRGAWRAAATAS